MCNNVECHGQDECLLFAAITSLLVTFCDQNLQTRVTVKSFFLLSLSLSLSLLLLLLLGQVGWMEPTPTPQQKYMLWPTTRSTN